MRWATKVAAIGILGLVAACGTRPPISLTQPPAPTVAPVAGAGAVRLDVVGQDKRPQYRDRVGTVRGSNAKVVTDTDVADFVRGAVEGALKAEGFALAAGGLTVTVELQNFYCDAGTGPTAAVAFTVRARTAAGRTLYSQHYEGTGRSGFVQSDENCKAALEQAVGSAVRQLADDKALPAALLSAGRS
jgi:uncharacterized lipoprotein YajG